MLAIVRDGTPEFADIGVGVAPLQVCDRILGIETDGLVELNKGLLEGPLLLELYAGGVVLLSLSRAAGERQEKQEEGRQPHRERWKHFYPLTASCALAG